jgi:aspartate/methionine/tyrosine aminotransferase
LLAELPKLGLAIPCPPQGAFYIYCDVSAITANSFEFCQRLLEASGVAVTPGIDFGEHLAQRYIRIAYSANLERLQEAVHRIQRFIEHSL